MYNFGSKRQLNQHNALSKSGIITANDWDGFLNKNSQKKIIVIQIADMGHCGAIEI